VRIKCFGVTKKDLEMYESLPNTALVLYLLKELAMQVHRSGGEVLISQKLCK
jgi:hypothetical protein